MNRRGLLVWLLLLLPAAASSQDAKTLLERRFDLRYSGSRALLGTEHNALLQVFDPWQGGPVHGAKVEATLVDESKNTLALGRGTTDSRGKVRFRLPTPIDSGRSRLRFKVEKEERIETWSIDLRGNRTGLVAYVSTDRAIYRSGETIHVRALALDRGRPAAKRSLRLEIMDGNWDELSRYQLETTDAGVASVRFEIPADVPTGPLYFDVEGDELGLDVRAGEIEVTNESEPRFRFAAKPVDRVVLGNAPWTVNVHAESFLDEPIQQAQIELSLDGATRATAETDAAGRAVLVIQPATLVEDWGQEPEQYRDITATVRARHPVSGRTEQRSLTLRRSPYELHVHAYRTRTALGGRRALWIVTSDAEGNPTSTEFEVLSVTREQGARAKNRWTWRQDRSLGRSRTNRLGIGRFEIQGDADRVVVVAAPGPDETRRPLGKTYAWAGGDRGRARRLDLRGRALWQPAEPIELTLSWAGEEDPPSLGSIDLELWRYDQDSPQLLDDRTVKLASEQALVRFEAGLFGPLDTTSLGRLYVVARQSVENGWYSLAGRDGRRPFSPAAVFPLAPRTMASDQPSSPSLAIETLSEGLRPGDTATLRLRFADAQGKNLEAVAGLAAVRANSREHQLVRQGRDSPPAFLAPFQEDTPRSVATVGTTSLLDLLEKPELDEAERLAARFLLDQASSLQARVLATQSYFDPLQKMAKVSRGRFYSSWLEAAKPQWTAKQLLDVSSSPEGLSAALAQLPHTSAVADALHDPWGAPYRFRAHLSNHSCTITARSQGADSSAETFDDFDAGWIRWPCFDNLLNVLTSILSTAFDEGRPRPRNRDELLQLVSELRASDPETAALIHFAPSLAELVDPWGQPWEVDWGDDTQLILRGGPEEMPVVLKRRILIKQRLLSMVTSTLQEAARGEPLAATPEGLASLWRRTLTQLGHRDLWDRMSDQYFLDWQREEGGPPTALSVVDEGADGLRRTEDDTTILEIACLSDAKLDAPSNQEPAEITVAVVDEDGTPLPGVTVEACSIYETRVAITDASGRARIPGLSPALLRVSATLEGLEPVETTRKARPNALLSHRFTLVRWVGDSITVTSEAPVLDERKLYQGTSISSVQNSLSLGTPPLRSDFRKTLAFFPEIALRDGTATVELPLSDDVTSWHIASVAHDVRGRIATAELELQSDLPVYVEPDVPARFTVGDKAQLPFLLHNREEDPRRTQWTFEADDALRLGGRPGPHRLMSGSTVRSLETQFRSPGSAKLRAIAKTQGPTGSPLSDAVEVPFIVEPNAYRGTDSITRLLRLDPEGEVTLSLDLPRDRLADLGSLEVVRIQRPLQLLEQAALDLERRPTGCTEQTVSAARLSLALLELGASTPEPALAARAERSRQHLDEAIQRVRRRQKPGGGFGYWTHDPGSLDLTAYVVDFLQRAEAWAGSSREGIDKAVRWIEAQLDSDRIGRVRPRTLVRLAAIDRRLEREGERSLLQKAARENQRAKTNIRREHRSPERTIDLASRLLAGSLHEDQEARLAKRLVARSQITSEGRYWTSSTPSVFYSSGRAGNVVATALALRALYAQGADDTLLTEGLAWLLQRQGPGGSWSNTEATVEAIETAIEIWGAQAPDKSVPPDFTLNEENLGAPDERTTRSLRDGSPELQIQGGEGWTLVRLSATYYRPWEAVKALQQHDELSLDIDCPERRVRRHTPITCRVSGTRSFGRGMLTARIGLPPGASLDIDHLRNQWEDSSVLNHWENGEDEVTLYLQPREGRFDFELRYEPHLVFEGVTKPSSLEQYYRTESRVVRPPRKVSILADAQSGSP
ncbi:MAG: carboxypeptidase regulatory-like domain-containing protein [Acidobacteriota bacterium]